MTSIVAPQSQNFTVNGLRLHHLAWGDPALPALVCVHGFRGNAHFYDNLAQRFADRYHVISLDVRGRGDSAWSPNGAYQISDYVSDLENIIDQLKIEKFSYIGTSMGGRIGMAYAAKHATRFTRLVLNDIGPDNEAGSNRISNEAGKTPDSFESFNAAVDYLRATAGAVGRMSEEAVLARARYTYRAREDGRWIAKSDPEFLRQRASGATPQLGHLWKVLETFASPTLLIWGTASDVLSETQARKIVRTLPNGTLAPVAGVGHPPTLDEPEAVTALEKFLGETN